MSENATCGKGGRITFPFLWISLWFFGAIISVLPSRAIALESSDSSKAASVSESENSFIANYGSLSYQEMELAQVPATPANSQAEPTLHPGASQLKNHDPMSQVNSVSQMRDVAPGDWAFEALHNLVERYGCIEGYPNSTYRGSRALTRYEFAAGLNACLQQIERLVASDTSTDTNQVAPEDLETLERLSAEFEAELATIDTRVNNLQERVTSLEENQFSTTTKITGNIFFNLTGAFAGDEVTAEGSSPFATERVPRAEGEGPLARRDPIIRQVDDTNTTFSNLVWLNLETSFTGEDSLVLQLAAGNGTSPVNEFASAGFFNSFGTPFVDQTAGVNSNDLILREAFYSFPVGKSFQIVVGPRINWYRYFDSNAFTFFETGASSYNSSGSTQLNTIDRGSGAVVVWDISEQFDLRVGYLGENSEFLPSPPYNSSSNPDEGLFGGTNTTTVELDFSPTDNITLRLIYDRSNLQAIDGLIGGAIGEPLPYGFADDGFGGSLNDATADTFALNFDALITPRFGIFGRYSYGSTNLDPVISDRPSGEVNTQSFQFGIASPDLGKEGALATLSFLVPHDILDGEDFLVSGTGDGGTQFEIEANYYYPLNDNIALVPAFYLIENANNFGDNPTIFVSNLRMQFSF